MPSRRAFMHRCSRQALSCVLGTAGVAASGLVAPTAQAALPSYRVGMAQLQALVDKRFPRSAPLAGLVELTVQSPQLQPLPERNRLRAVFAVQATSAALAQPQQGTLTVECALRYAASDRTVRAHQITVGRLDFAGLPPELLALLNLYGPALAEQLLREVVLHQLEAKDLVLLDTMGLQPGAITVTREGLTVAVVSKPLSQP